MNIASIELRNATTQEFTDISSEKFREYIFDVETIRIVNPAWLSVSKSGGHRILDEYGHCWYIPHKWIAIRWDVKEGQPHFVK